MATMTYDTRIHPAGARRRPAPDTRTQRGALRLTRRGRAAVIGLLAVLLLLAFGLGRASGADAGSDLPPAQRRTVVVRPGETLWSIARRAAPGTDPRETVERIRRLNDLRGPLEAGRRIVLP